MFLLTDIRAHIPFLSLFVHFISPDLQIVTWFYMSSLASYLHKVKFDWVYFCKCLSAHYDQTFELFCTKNVIM